MFFCVVHGAGAWEKVLVQKPLYGGSRVAAGRVVGTQLLIHESKGKPLEDVIWHPFSKGSSVSCRGMDSRGHEWKQGCPGGAREAQRVFRNKVPGK